MRKINYFIGITFTILFSACGHSQSPQRYEEVADMEMISLDEEKASEDASYWANNSSVDNALAFSYTRNANPQGNGFISSSAAVENPQDTTHKFIRTADLKFKVKDVIKSTYDIENITGKQNGFVTSTHLTSNINRITTTEISNDSSLVSTCYTVINDITLRVPNVKLDTTLKEIARNIDFLDYRTIKAQDVSLSILTNSLTQKRLAKNEKRLTDAIDNRGRRLNETTSAEELLLRKQEQADNAKIANLSLADQINFSTIHLSIYQRETIKREVIANDKNINAYEPGFGSKLLDALKIGWNILESIVIFIANLWALVLVVVVGYIIYRKYGDKLRRKS